MKFYVRSILALAAAAVTSVAMPTRLAAAPAPAPTSAPSVTVDDNLNRMFDDSADDARDTKTAAVPLEGR